MDFFAQQDLVRKKTGLLLTYFTLAVVSTVLLIYFVPVIGWWALKLHNAKPGECVPLVWWRPELFLLVCGLTLLVVLGGALFKIAQLRRNGGGGVAEMLGGRPVSPATSDFFEKRLLNVVEEMAIASGIPAPPVYLLGNEKGINAFAAGFSSSTSVIAVTYGTMTGLTREELQGVVAHEFSHILNNDVRLNVGLMGFLHGLLIIGLTGRIVMQFVSRGSTRRSRDSWQITLFLLAAGATLLVVGFTGLFFCKLIKASISRSRERLADASAVQFTRNPDGLSAALKKIGGLANGSRLQTAHAEQASHMFFCDGLKNNLFGTHPPLPERIRWLDPHFNGQFPSITYEDLRKQLARFESAPLEKEEKQKADFVDLFTDPGKVAIAATVIGAATPPKAPPGPNNPEALIATVGAPMQCHADAAKRLIESIPEKAKEYARDPYGARMLVYFLLLDARDDVRERQMTVISERGEPETVRILEEAVPNLNRIQPQMRLPLVDLAIPSLRFLSPEQFETFREIVRLLVYADDRVDVFEYALQRVLRHHLDPLFGRSARKPGPVNYYSIRGLAKETSVVLSVLVRKSTESTEEAEAAFETAAKAIADSVPVELNLLVEAECTWENFDAALDKINEGSFKVKKWVLGGALAGLMHDRQITVAEVELFRAIADSLGCPVPPWVAPTEDLTTDRDA